MLNIKLPSDVKGLECRHATYCEHRDGQNDLLAVKEYIHYKDGRVVPNLRLIENYKREFWVTLPAYQNHKDKKEWEEEKRCRKFSTTQIKMRDNTAKALGKPGLQTTMRGIARSPFLYGCDVDTTVLIKNDYQKTFDDCITHEARVAVFDIETDVVEGHEEPISASLTCKDKVYLGVTESFLGTIIDPETKIQKAFDKYLRDKDYIKDRNITVEIFIGKTSGEVMAKVLMKAHEWKPDFVTVWNINFDLPKVVKQFDKEGIDPADVFSDPSVPREYRFYRYKEGPSKKKTAKGKVFPLHPADRWHTASFPATWYAVDAMCLYKRIRTVEGNESSYALDAILNSNLNLGKLKFTEVDNYVGLAWHYKMQSQYKIEYLIYNIFDCVGVELLDEKNGDISRSFNVLAGISDYNNFNSNPRRICDDLHFECRDRGLVIATTSDQMVDDFDKYVISMEGWIVTLPSFLTDDNGLTLIKEAPHIKSMMRAHVADLDIEGTYPNIEDICNISKETTAMELHDIDGVPEAVRRSVGVNLTGGAVNAIEICQRIYNLPTSNKLLEAFERELAK